MSAPLPPGEYLWEISGTGPLGAAEERRGFRVATAAERDRIVREFKRACDDQQLVVQDDAER